MTGPKQAPPMGDQSLAAGRSAGYCWRKNPTGAGRCTLQPGHGGGHVDHYNGRRKVTDTSGYRWP